jgi:cytochrome c
LGGAPGFGVIFFTRLCGRHFNKYREKMNKLFKAVLLGVFAAALSAPSFAADKASADDAVALVKKAAAFLKANGKEKAMAEFNNGKGQFIDRDLYIFVTDMKGTMLANGSNQKLVGKDLMALKDADGKAFVKAYTELTTEKGKGWVDYKWQNPATKAIDQKSSYVEKHDDLIIGAGIYK